MKILIVDDEPLARERLAALLRDCDNVEIAGEAGDGRAALEAAARLHPDVVLLDIRMPLMDGLEAARHFAGFDKPPAIVFCTAYDEHAIKAFELHAVDYLLKPFSQARFDDALARARELHAPAAKAVDSTTPCR